MKPEDVEKHIVALVTAHRDDNKAPAVALGALLSEFFTQQRRIADALEQIARRPNQ